MHNCIDTDGRAVRSHQEQGICWPESTSLEKKGHSKPKMCPLCGIDCADGKDVSTHYKNYHSGTKKVKSYLLFHSFIL